MTTLFIDKIPPHLINRCSKDTLNKNLTKRQLQNKVQKLIFKAQSYITVCYQLSSFISQYSSNSRVSSVRNVCVVNTELLTKVYWFSYQPETHNNKKKKKKKFKIIKTGLKWKQNFKKILLYQSLHVLLMTLCCQVPKKHLSLKSWITGLNLMTKNTQELIQQQHFDAKLRSVKDIKQCF